MEKVEHGSTFYVYASCQCIVSTFVFARKTLVKNYSGMEIQLYVGYFIAQKRAQFFVAIKMLSLRKKCYFIFRNIMKLPFYLFYQ